MNNFNQILAQRRLNNSLNSQRKQNKSLYNDSRHEFQDIIRSLKLEISTLNEDLKERDDKILGFRNDQEKLKKVIRELKDREKYHDQPIFELQKIVIFYPKIGLFIDQYPLLFDLSRL